MGLVGSLFGQESILTDRLPERSMGGLEALLEAAMTQSTSIRIRDLIEDNYEGRSLVSKSSKQFKLGGTAKFRKEQDVEKADSEIRDRVYYSLTLSKTLYHWGALEANKDKGNLSLQMEELKTFEAYRTLALSVRKSYLNILIARKNIETSEKSLELYRKQLELEEKRFETGAASHIQVYDLTLRVNGAELDILKKENVMQDQIDVLARLVGVSSSDVERSLSKDIPKSESLDSAQIQALENFFDGGIEQSAALGQSAKAVEYYQKDLHIANQRRKPKIGMSVGMTQYDLDERGTRRAEEIFYGGVSISWSIFDGSATRGYKRSAMAQVEQMKARFEDAKSSYRFNLERAQRLLDVNARILKRDEAALDIAIRHAKEAGQELDEGRISFVDVGRVEQILVAQELRTYRSRAAYLNALSTIASQLGLDPFARKFIDSRTQ